MVKAVILVFCSTQQHFIRNICAKFATTNPSQSLDLGQYSDGDIFDFWIFGQSFINENCHNSRTSHDIDIEFGPVNKLDKRNTATSKKFDDDPMSANCDMVFSQIYGQFAAIEKPDSGRMVYKTYVSLIVTFHLTELENRTKKSLT